tara:strand:+ start:948 stop:1682 length:735 start_codon:yes stop_codon:yes gene_type:complete
MRLLPFFCIIAIFIICVFTVFIVPARAETVTQIARTNENTLNDLVGRLPILFVPNAREAGQLSALQELLVLHELKMRGEGLPEELASALSGNYSAIISALIEDRIPEDYGFALLSYHRGLLNESYEWMGRRDRDDAEAGKIIETLQFYREELNGNAISLWDVPDSLRTPVINGYQVWVNELLNWGCDCRQLSPGNLSRVGVLADELARFEGYYKRDGVVHPYEREQLHGRFLKITLKTIEILGR